MPSRAWPRNVAVGSDAAGDRRPRNGASGLPKPDDTPRGPNARGLRDVSVIEAANSEEEALAIAVVLRETAETEGKSAALVTPDRALARRVLAACSRWNLPVDDSGGDALTDTHRRNLRAARGADRRWKRLAPATIARTAQASAVAAGAAMQMAMRRRHRNNRTGAAARLAPGAGLRRASRRAFEAFDADMRSGCAVSEPSGIHRAEPRAALTEAEIDQRTRADRRALLHALAPLDEVPPRGEHPLTDLATRHREVVARLGVDAIGEIACFR